MQTENDDDAIKSVGRASPLMTPASRIPRWMYQLMCERGSHQPRDRSRSHPSTASDHLGERLHPAALLHQHDTPAVVPERSTATQSDSILTECSDPTHPAVEANTDCHSCDTVLAPPPPSCTPADDSLPSPQPLTDAHHPRRTTYRDSYGDFSSASSNASSSTSYSGGFDSSRSASSVTSASSAMTFSAATAGWTGQSGSPSNAPSSPFEGRKRSPVGCRATAASSEAEGGSKVPPRSHLVVDDDPEVTLCLSRLHLPPSAEVQIFAPDEADTTPLASTSRLASEFTTAATASAVAAPSPPSPTTTATSHLSLETTATHPSPIAPIPLVDDGTLQAPENFATVSTDLYRSSFPRKQHFPFLKNLGLKSVMVLVQEPYPEENAEFLAKEGIQLFQYGIPGNKEPFVSIPDDKVVAALTTILDKRNHPMLIHCNKGKHRTGCVVGCLRRIQSWSLTSIFDEYRRYSTPKSRAMDLQFIEAFGGLPDVWRLCDREQLPRWPTLEAPPLPAPSDPPAQPP